MVRLVASDPFGEALPVDQAGLRIEVGDAGALTWISPFAGQEQAVSAALEATHGLRLSEPGRMLASGEARCLWFARGQALLCGPALAADLDGLAAVVDQSDGWVSLKICGEQHVDVLARLVPVDLRVSAFPSGAVVRSLVKHTGAMLVRTSEETVEIFVMRSFAKTLVGDLREASEGLALRG
ncbi:sarcosine oxidase subunit gamma [Aestuariibius insulae]|uniref:sarcosine oxidase subunit gamma n=1 Tax=Aestuariibius insulae TaxID=2058287 RepID=UPI00345E112B